MENNIKVEREGEQKEEKVSIEKGEKVRYFQCESCSFREKYEYFGFEPPFSKKFKLLEPAYVIEDPFLPPKQGEIIILGSKCINCSKKVCKDMQCSFYFNGTYCVSCAKMNLETFPTAVKEKLNKLII